MDPDGRRKVQEIEGISPLPVGSQKATEFYAQAALDAGVARVNGRPVLIVRHPARVCAAVKEEYGRCLSGTRS